MAETAAAIQFQTDAPDVETLHVAELRGTEEISRPYEFELELYSRQREVKLESLVRHAARLLIKVPAGGPGRVRTGLIHGVLSSFEQLEMLQEGVRYRAVLVPKLARFALSVQSRIYLDKDVREIVKEVLEAEVAGRRRFTAEDYEFRTAGRYSRHEHVLQYQESDLDFISRWAENEGVFYSFQQRDESARVVFGDHSDAFAAMPGDAPFPYRPDQQGPGPAAGSEGTGEEAIRRFGARQRCVPAKVVLRDYNYRTPAARMEAEAEVDSRDEGEVYRYGDHFKSEAEGKALAKLRAEELKCRQVVFAGTGNCRGFRAGLKFSLGGHYRGDFNGEYLLMTVSHRATQQVGPEGVQPGSLAYENEFTCIPASVPFRPERRTPAPRVQGPLFAVVDAAGDGQYAEVDEEGRYKVKLFIDRSDRADGKASRPVRMAQPYGGSGMGFHFPLHKKTEVLVAHANGDPDRPIILSAVPNPETPSLIRSENQTHCELKSGGNNEIRFKDDSGSEQVFVHAQKDLQLVVENDGTSSVGHDLSSTVGHNSTSSVGKDESHTVENDRSVTSGHDESRTVGNDRSQSVGNNDSLTVGNDRTESMGGSLSVSAGKSIAQAAPQQSFEASSGDLRMKAAVGILGDAQKVELTGSALISLKVGGCMLEIGPAGVTLVAGGSTIKLTPAGVEISGTQVSSAATASNQVSGGAGVKVESGGIVSLKGAMITNNS